MTERDSIDLDSGATWQKLFERVPLQILGLDLEGRILYVNRSFAGRPLDEMTGTHIEDHMPGKDHVHIRKLLSDVVSTGEATRFETSMILEDWSHRWFASYITPYLQGREVTGFIVINQDITEQKTTERALRESEYKFRALAEQSPNMIFINQKGRVVFANRMCEQLTGYTQEEFYAPDFDYLSIFASDSLPLVQQNFVRQMQDEEIPPQEYTFVTKSGTLLEGLVTTRLFSYESETAVLGIVTDITDRKKAEIALKRAHAELELRVEERTAELTVANERKQLEIEQRSKAEAALKAGEGMLRSILDSSPDAIMMIDINGNFIECNRSAVEQLRFRSKEEMLQRNSFDLVVDKDQARAMRNTEETIRLGTMPNIEYQVQRRDGTVIYTESSASVIKNSKGEISGFVVVAKDISERKASEEALLLSQVKLRDQKKALEQKNIALGEIIAQVEIEKQKIKEDITLNVQRVLFPILDELDRAVDPKPLLDVFRRNLEGLASSYGSRITEKTTNLTPREVEICSMIKGGLSSKDISEILNISQATVERHRKNIRSKLNLTNQDINLATFLRNL
ncbi:MAG: PAS domain S-box protein [Candidatus Aminicenantaceae bacterium]